MAASSALHMVLIIPGPTSRFVVDLRERMDYWTPYYNMHPRERNRKCSAGSTYHKWCALPANWPGLTVPL